MKLLAISPHLDDAAFSAGGLLAARAQQGWQVTVATCFTGNVDRPTGFALACQLDKGLAPEVDYMALRRAEDIDACRELGARAIHLPFLEAPHRGYETAAMLFRPRLETDRIVEPLTTALAALVAAERPDLILGPLCLGNHVDHHAVRVAMVKACAGHEMLWWEDWPYADREARVDAAPAFTQMLTPDLRTRRIAACAAYASQLGFQFGGTDKMATRIGTMDEERYYTLS